MSGVPAIMVKPRVCTVTTPGFMLAKALRNLNDVVYEEVYDTYDDGSNKRIDIIAIKKYELKSVILVLDPTNRFEMHRGQPGELHEEKKTTYMPIICYLKLN